MNNRNLILRRQDLIENPTPRVAVCLVLDCSPSMSGDPSWGAVKLMKNPSPIEALNEGVKNFYAALKEDEVARYAAEVAIVAFSGMAEKIEDFGSIERANIPMIELETTYGGTSLGTAVDQALELLIQRKSEYKDAGVDYFQPWMVIMTDGAPTDDTHYEAANRVAEMVKQKKLTIFPIGIGDGARLDVLQMFSPNRQPLRLKGLRFKEFFSWLSKSISNTSRSTPGEKIELDVDGIKGWGEL